MSDLTSQIPQDWRAVLKEEIASPYFRELETFVGKERQGHTIFPPEEDVFNAFKLTGYDDVRVLLLGQDPYHGDGQAHGLAFSVRPSIAPPPSLVNIYKELQTDLGCSIPSHGYLVRWADQGVMLLNTVLTVRAHQANSHKGQGWEKFTDAVIEKISAREKPVVFLLWGSQAKKKKKLIDKKKHAIVEGTHPSPLSAHMGFWGSKPFSAVNGALKNFGQPEIDWQIPPLS